MLIIIFVAHVFLLSNNLLCIYLCEFNDLYKLIVTFFSSDDWKTLNHRYIFVNHCYLRPFFIELNGKIKDL